jgi:hypothetical protein
LGELKSRFLLARVPQAKAVKRRLSGKSVLFLFTSGGIDRIFVFDGLPHAIIFLLLLLYTSMVLAVVSKVGLLGCTRPRGSFSFGFAVGSIGAFYG